MPKFLDAILAGTLIAFSPEMLQITFVHAEIVDSPGIVYGVLCLVVLLLVGMIVLYIWIGQQSRPSGFEEVLKQLGRSIGQGKDTEDTTTR